MRQTDWPRTMMQASCLAYGCMHLGGSWDDRPVEDETVARAERLILRARGAEIHDRARVALFER